MAVPVTDSLSPHGALQRKPAASLFCQRVARLGLDRRRCCLSMPREQKCEGHCGDNSQFAHDSPCLEDARLSLNWSKERIRTQPPEAILSGFRESRLRAEQLLHVANKIDADDVTRCILDRLVARDVGLAQDGGISIVRFALIDHRERGAFGVQDGPHRA